MRRRRTATACATLAVVLLTWRSAAAWTAVGAGAASAGASNVPAAPAPTASPTVGGATLTWSPVVGATAYRVRRYDVSGSPATPGGACASAVVATTCLDSPAPPGSWTYAIRGVLAAWTGSEGPAGAPIAIAAVDTTPPTVSAAAVARSGGGTAGAIRPGATYYLYAAAADTGVGATGMAGVRADASAITAGQTSVALSSGSWTLEGVAYGWRSASLVASSSLTDGTSLSVPVTATDRAGNAGGRTATVSIDATPPTGVDVQTANGGTTAGRADGGDKVYLTYSEALDPSTILGGWNGSGGVSAVVRITDGGTGNDVLSVWNAANSSLLPLGSIDLGASDYVSASTTFGSGGTASSLTISGTLVTVTLGTSNASSRTIAGGAGSTMTWTPSASLTDRAGNGCSTTVREETGTLDREF